MGKTEIGHKRKYSLRPFFLKKNRKDKKKKRFKKPSSEQNDESLKSKN